MEEIRRSGEAVIQRALLFTTLAVVTTMIGFMAEPGRAFAVGAALTALAGAVLALKGLWAPRRPYRRTEVWLLLDRKVPLPEPQAQAVFGRILRQLYYGYAKLPLAVAVLLWVLGLIFRLAA